MTTNFKRRSRKLFGWSAGLFVVLFTFRMIYGYVNPETGKSQSYSDDYFSNISNLRKNYASEQVKTANIELKAPPSPKMSLAVAPPPISSSQKFEKTASVKSKSTEFEKDEKQTKLTAKSFNAVIQYEQNTGQKGNRQIHMLIGVNPALFDSFCVAIQKIGVVKVTEVTKVDKTNEYRQLNAQKTSLEKTLQSLIDLKAKEGKIADYISLHDKILEIEERLQNLGVELGNFDSENEFCTVRLSIYEGAAEKGISFIHRVKVAFEWAITYFSIIVFITLGVTAVIYVMLLIIDKAKAINAAGNKMGE